MFDIYFAADDAAHKALNDQCEGWYPLIWVSTDPAASNKLLVQIREAGARLSTWHAFDKQIGDAQVREEALRRNVTEGQAIVLGARTEAEFHAAVNWINVITTPLMGA